MLTDISYDRTRLERHFREHGCVSDFFYSDSIDSTNQWAKRMFPRAHRTLFLANAQTAGRGRFGRRWLSPAGVGIYMSIVLDSRPLPEAGAFWNFAATWAVVQALGPAAKAVACKWPNDLWSAGRKMGGVLVEMVYRGAQSRGLVVGIGLNVHPMAWPSTIHPRPISLDEATGQTWNRTTLVIAITDALAEADRMWQRGQGSRLLQSWFQMAQWQPGQRIWVRMEEQLREFIIAGIEPDGSLHVTDPETNQTVWLSIYEALGWTETEATENNYGAPGGT